MHNRIVIMGKVNFSVFFLSRKKYLMSSLAMSVRLSVRPSFFRGKNYWQQFWILTYPVDWSQIYPKYRTEPMFVSWFQRAYFYVSLGSVWLKYFIWMFCKWMWPLRIICVVPVLQLSSQILPRIRGACLRQTKIIIRYIYIRYTRFVTEF